MIKIIKLTQTTTAAPMQFEGITEYGRDVYIRVRWGNLSVAINGKEIYHGTVIEDQFIFDNIKKLTAHLISEWPDNFKL